MSQTFRSPDAGILATIVIAALLAPGTSAAASVDAGAAFERLKGLAGTWKAEVAASHAAETPGDLEAVHEFRVSANGSVVMEVMREGTADEMINMYHLDGEELVVRHYCSSGNQPRLRLDQGSSEPGSLVFVFDGGTNLDAATDTHIHGLEVVFLDDGRLDSVWSGWAGGEAQGTTTFRLSRATP